MSEEAVINEDVPAPTVAEEDLEDGEIDDEDDDDDAVVVVTPTVNVVDKKNLVEGTETFIADTASLKQNLSNDDSPSKGAANKSSISKLSKSSKKEVVVDDIGVEIEKALASALQKEGVEPSMPKILEIRSEDNEKTERSKSGKSSRRRKRKQREEKDNIDGKRKKYRSPAVSPEPTKTVSAIDDAFVDEYEMMCVRGGSPPPVNDLWHPPPPSKKYESEDSCSSYESFESAQERYRKSVNDKRKRKEPSRKRRTRSKRRDGPEMDRGGIYDSDGGGGGGGGGGVVAGGRKEGRRNRKKDNGDQPIDTYELCKFYLMDCCAKKEQCSYMHSNFPCKYYYLGMDCVYGDDCKYSHGKPLTEKLRSVLIKHLETAPKEILGSFRRISRETAFARINKRHLELCEEQGIENTLVPKSQPPLLQLPVLAPKSNNCAKTNQLQDGCNETRIPALMEMVIKPPTITTNTTNDFKLMTSESAAHLSGNQKRQRKKSRWCEDMDNEKSVDAVKPVSVTDSAAAFGQQERPSSTSPPSSLDLNNLTGILKAEQIEKLSQLGVFHVEQIDQLTVYQLNKIGLTIAEISEIQMNAKNKMKLGVLPANNSTAATADADHDNDNKISSTSTNTISTTQDIDMRFLPPSCLPSVGATSNISITVSPEQKEFISETKKKSISGNVLQVDYTQYLKDSHVTYDRNDSFDDEKDEETLVMAIDDQDTDDGDDDLFASSKNAEDETTSDNNSPQHNANHNFLAQFKNIAAKNHDQDQDKTFSLHFEKEKSSSKTFRDPRLLLKGHDSTKSQSIHENNSNNNSHERERDDYKSKAKSRWPRSESRSRSRSVTPTKAQSPSPHVYERASMYDYNSATDDDKLSKNSKADRDMRLSRFVDGANSDMDLRLPFQPIAHYVPATEIDASVTSHSPIIYKVYDIDVSKPNYSELRQQFTSDQTSDPRLRRILGLAELGITDTAASLNKPRGRSDNKTANSTSVSSPASPVHYSSPQHHIEDSAVTQRGPRMDPRRASASSAAMTSSNLSSPATGETASRQQHVEIRKLLQNSEWYKNLNSKFKIMVNQQLAHVSTELRKFHQDPSPNKVFDIQFIVSNQYLQQILTNLGVYIDDNGEIVSVESGSDAPICNVNRPPFMNYGGAVPPQMMMNENVGNIQSRGPRGPLINNRNMNMSGGGGPGDFGPQNMFSSGSDGRVQPGGGMMGYFRNSGNDNMVGGGGGGGEFNNPFSAAPYHGGGGGGGNKFFGGGGVPNDHKMPKNCNNRNLMFNRNRNRN